jgi:hypothetical protein
MKTCTRCNVEKPLDDFHKRAVAKDGLTWYCKPCGTDAAVRDNRRRTTGWSDAQFNAAWESQKAQCAICSVTMVPKGRGPASVNADHCHAGNKTRALLCANCNQMLGRALDNPETLRRAASYLEHHSDD